MSGHRPFALLRDEVRRDPDRARRAEEHKQSLLRGIDLAEARRQAGMSQVQVAHIMGVTQANVSRIEHGDDAQISTLNRYAAALGGTLHIEIVFSDEGSEKARSISLV